MFTQLTPRTRPSRQDFSFSLSVLLCAAHVIDVMECAGVKGMA